MKDWDPPLLNQPIVKGLLSTDLIKAEALFQLDNGLKLQAYFRVAELRKSCGIESQLSTVNVRLPPRYQESSK